MYVSEVKTDAPVHFETELHRRVYEILNELQIPFERVDNDPAVTMEDCIEIDERLQTQTIKTLFLCNRQKTSFYLFMTPPDKPFVTKDFSRTLGISRVSFAPEELLWSLLQIKPGATTVLGAAVDEENRIRIIIDKDILSREYIGLTDGTTTGYMKLKTADVLDRYLPYTKHKAEITEIHKADELI